MTELATFWDETHPLSAAYQELSNKLIPEEGKCETLQGEFLRASNKISWDWFNNGWGCNNWSGAVVFLKKFFKELPVQPDAEVLTKLKKELNYVYEYSHGEPPPVDDDRADIAVTTIHEIVVQAIIDNPEPILNTRDMWDFSEDDYRSRNNDWEDGDGNAYYY